MKDPLALSIPHTGTRTVRAILDCGFVHSYLLTYPNYVDYIKMLNAFLLVVPLRDPKKTWTSWVNRWEEKRGEVPLEMFAPQWDHIATFEYEFDVFYLPIDIPERENQLKKLGQVLHRSLKADWDSLAGRVAPSAEYDYFNPEVYDQPDWGHIYKLPFVARYYNGADTHGDE